MIHAVPLKRVIDSLPFSPSSIYSGFSRGRYPWLTRNDPLTGRRGRELFVLVDVLTEWLFVRGLEWKQGTLLEEIGRGPAQGET